MKTVVFCVWILLCFAPLILKIGRIIRKRESVHLKWAIWVAGIGLVSYIILDYFSARWLDLLWFEELGYAQLFWPRLKFRLFLFLGGAFLALISFGVNLTLTMRVERKLPMDQIHESDTARMKMIWVSLGSVVGASLLFGLIPATFWEEMLLWFNQIEFGIIDPIFGEDLSFYLFSLPVLRFFGVYLSLLLLCNILFVLSIYGFYIRFIVWRWFSLSSRNSGWKASMQNQDEKDELTPREIIRFAGITHVSIIGVLLMVSLMFVTWVSRWGIMYSKVGVVLGAGYGDIHQQLPAYWIFIATLAVAAALLIRSAIAHSLAVTTRMCFCGFLSAILVWIFVVNLFPKVWHKAVIQSNEQEREAPYIQHNINFTRQAFGLNDDLVTRVDFPVDELLSWQALNQSQGTLDSVRLWDYRILQTSYAQQQTYRTYYSFGDVDVERYRINGKLVQVMYGARELDQNKLASQAQTWQNKHLVYTHGFGACANPVNVFLPGGGPDYWLSNLPSKARFSELEIKQPRIYFGEATDEYVFVGTSLPEFDYPQNESQDATCFYNGPAGIQLGSGLRKFMIAFVMDDLKILISDELIPQSRVLLRRDLETRVKTLVPFLQFDPDPYQVISEKGELWYLWDAFTVSSDYPYSQPLKDLGYNYIRNSVKAVINAYTGQVSFYVFDDRDPIIRSYMKIFPDVFRLAKEMPIDLKQHVRYPESLLRWQAEVYSTYHMTDVKRFYNKEDVWDISKEIYSGQTRTMDPYYVVMKVPGQTAEEFVLILPFSPLSTDPKNPRANMVSWLAARCDGDHYGKLLLYMFPKDRLIYGPLQLGIKINQDDNISKDITLWNQQGSKVMFGNVIVIPLDGWHLISVQPIYLQADAGKMPEIKRVVVSNGERLGYGTSFPEALEKLVGKKGLPASLSSADQRQEDPKSKGTTLIDEAAQVFNHYQQLMGEGKFTEAGSELEKLGRILNLLLNHK